MLRAGFVRASAATLIALPFAFGLLLSTPQTASAESGETVTTELQPGLNLAGWTEPEAGISAIFEAIPQLEAVYAWDAENQRFRLALRTDPGGFGDLPRLTPGMAIWLLVAGEEPFTWTRPVIRHAGAVSLYRGWNLVVWAGEDRIATTDALRHIDDLVREVADAGGGEPAVLTTGGAFWLKTSADKQWWQLTPPPTIEFLSDYSPERQRQARALVDNVVTYFGRRFGLGIPGLLVQFGDKTRIASGVCGAYSSSPGPRITMAPKALTDSGCSIALAHEYVHGIQHLLRTRGGELAAASFHEPFWFREGVANHWPTQAVEAEGGKTYADHFREVVLFYSRFFPVSLQGMDDYGRYSYELSQLAVRRLASLVGEQTLYDFYARGSNFATWEEAFHATFGMTTDAFYEDFASYRAEVAPPKARVNAVVLGPGGAPLEGITLGTNRLSDGQTWSSFTNAEGSLPRWWPDPGSYALSLFVDDCPVPWTSDSQRVTMTGAHTAQLELAPGDVEDLVIVVLSGLPSETCR